MCYIKSNGLNSRSECQIIYHFFDLGPPCWCPCEWAPTKIFFFYLDTDVIPGFFLLLKNHIFIVHSEDPIFYNSHVKILMSSWLVLCLFCFVCFTRHLVCLFYQANLPRGKEHEQDSGSYARCSTLPYQDQKDQTTTPGTTCPTLCEQSVSSLTSHRIIRNKDCETMVSQYCYANS